MHMLSRTALLLLVPCIAGDDFDKIAGDGPSTGSLDDDPGGGAGGYGAAQPYAGGWSTGGVYGGGYGVAYGSSPPPPAAAADDGQKTGPDPCFFSAKGVDYSLDDMFRSDHDYTGTTNGGYAYRFNVCGNTVKTCNAQPAPASKWRGSKCNNLGDPTTRSIGLLDEQNPGKGVKVSFTKGDICKQQKAGQMEIGSRSVTYEIECNPSANPGELKAIKEVSMCDYLITFESVYGCPANRSKIHGWALITFFTLGVILYCGIGFYLNQKSGEKHGVEAIPHLEYWEQVPGLVRDGLMFSVENSKVALEVAQAKGKAGYEFVKEKYQSRGAGV